MPVQLTGHTNLKCVTCGHPESIHDAGGTACDSLFCNCNRFAPPPPTREEHEQARRLLLAEHYKRRLEALTDEQQVTGEQR